MYLNNKRNTDNSIIIYKSQSQTLKQNYLDFNHEKSFFKK